MVKIESPTTAASPRRWRQSVRNCRFVRTATYRGRTRFLPVARDERVEIGQRRYQRVRFSLGSGDSAYHRNEIEDRKKNSNPKLSSWRNAMKSLKKLLVLGAVGMAMPAANVPAQALNPQPIPPREQRVLLKPGQKNTCWQSLSYGALLKKKKNPLPPSPCRR